METTARRAVAWPPTVTVPADRVVTTGLGVVHVLAVAWLVAGGGLYIDDIRAQAYAAGRSWWPFVVESNRTHLAPGARTVDWFMARYAPLEHWPAVVITVAIAALLAAATTMLAYRAIRHPWARVLAVAWVLLAASAIPTYAWFRQALTTMLPIALLLLTTSLVIDHARTRARRPWVAAVATHALALTLTERALAVPFVVAAVLATCRPAHDRRRRWSRSAGTLAPFALLNVGFLFAYSQGDFDTAEGSRPSVADAVVKLGRWAVVDLLPSFVGGPVRWRPGNGAYSFADTPLVLVVVAAVLLVLGVVVALRTPGSMRATAPAACVALAYSVPVLTMIYVGRLAQVDDITAADDLRLLPDVSVATSMAAAALVGAVLERRSRPVRLSSRRSRRRVLVVGVAASAVLGAVSWLGFGARWHVTPVPAFLTAMSADVRSTTGQVLPTPVPPEVVPGWVDAAFTTAPLIELVNPAALSAELSEAPTVVGPQGNLVPAALGRVAGADVPEGFCGRVLDVGVRSATFVLTDDAPYYRGSAVVLGILVGDAERLNIRVTDQDGRTSGPLVQDPPELLRGPHRIIATVPHGTAVRSITVEVESTNTDGVCVTSAQVSVVRPSS
ncbi:MAG: hypothetical protein ACRCSN_22355 [Dermatophilaceae bacterium]